MIAPSLPIGTDVTVTDAVGNKRRARVTGSTLGPIAGLAYKVRFDDDTETHVVAARVKRATPVPDQRTFEGYVRTRRAAADTPKGEALRLLRAHFDEHADADIASNDDLNRALVKVRASATARWAARELLTKFLSERGEA